MILLTLKIWLILLIPLAILVYHIDKLMKPFNRFNIRLKRFKIRFRDYWRIFVLTHPYVELFKKD